MHSLDNWHCYNTGTCVIKLVYVAHLHGLVTRVASTEDIVSLSLLSAHAMGGIINIAIIIDKIIAMIEFLK